MATGFPYESLPLDPAQQEIRLLVFKVSKSTTLGDPIICSMRKISLQESPIQDYYAASYTWGDNTERRMIEIDTHEVSIGESAYQTLLHLRTHTVGDCSNAKLDTVQINLWVDAICINQSSIPERNSQISMMGDVYASAVETLVYLGDDAGRGEETFDLIAQIYDHCRSSTKDVPLTEFTRLAQHGSQSIEEYKPVFKPRSQSEQYAGEDAIVLDLDLDQWALVRRLYECAWFSRIWVIQELLLAKDSTCYYGEAKILTWPVLTAATWLGHGGYWMQDGDARGHGIDRANSMLYLREMSQYLTVLIVFTMLFEASQPRDRIYGILGLVQRRYDCSVLEPDYAKPIVDVYRDATRFSLEQERRFNLLELTGYGYQHEGPSWVPWFDCLDNPKVLLVPSLEEGPPILGTGCSDENVLTIRGAVLDRIVHLGRDMQAVGDSYEELGVWLYAELQSLGVHLPEGHDLSLHDLARILACESDDYTDMQTTPLSDAITSFFDCFEIEGPKGGPKCRESTSKAHGFIGLAGLVLTQRRWFITESSRVGMCDHRVEAGDNVCHLYGGKHPSVLRQEGSEWKLLGSCHVHDLANVSTALSTATGTHCNDADWLISELSQACRADLLRYPLKRNLR